MATRFSSSTHCNKFLFTPEELSSTREKDRTVFSDDELNLLHSHFCGVLRDIGRCMNLRARVIATALTYFRRYYLRNSFLESDPWLVGPTCLYLACKVEECPQPAKKVDLQMSNCYEGRYTYATEDILDTEYILLEQLDFCLIAFHGYRNLPKFVADAGMNQDFLEMAWHMVNDICCTPAVLLAPPHVIALAAILLVALIKGEMLTEWFSNLDVNLEQVWDVGCLLLDYHQLCLSPLANRLEDLLDKLASSGSRNKDTKKRPR